MTWPKTSDQMKAEGYEYLNDSRCSGPNCREEIEWWLSPQGKRQPFSVRKAGNVLFNSGEVRNRITLPVPTSINSGENQSERTANWLSVGVDSR